MTCRRRTAPCSTSTSPTRTPFVCWNGGGSSFVNSRGSSSPSRLNTQMIGGMTFEGSASKRLEAANFQQASRPSVRRRHVDPDRGFVEPPEFCDHREERPTRSDRIGLPESNPDPPLKHHERPRACMRIARGCDIDRGCPWTWIVDWNPNRSDDSENSRPSAECASSPYLEASRPGSHRLSRPGKDRRHD